MSRDRKSQGVKTPQASEVQVKALESWLGLPLAQHLADDIEPAYSLGEWFRLTTFLAAYRRCHQ